MLLVQPSLLLASLSLHGQTSSRECRESSLAHSIRVARSSIARRSLRHPLELRVISAAPCCEASEHGKRTLASNDNFSLPTRKALDFVVSSSIFSTTPTSPIRSAH